jgi:hypothetical protein
MLFSGPSVVHVAHPLDRNPSSALSRRSGQRSVGLVPNALKPLNGTMIYAVRKGWLSQNPVALLTRDERPTIRRREMRILDSEGIVRLLAAASDKYRPSTPVRSTPPQAR